MNRVDLLVIRRKTSRLYTSLISKGQRQMKISEAKAEEPTNEAES